MSAPRRLYIGRLPQEASSEEVSKLFEAHGRVVDCRVMTGFGFVEFEDGRDAQDALDKMDGQPFQGQNLLVEFAKENGGRRRERAPQDDRDRGFRSRRPPGFRVVVSGLARETSWQDLKDFGREAGNVTFADIDRHVMGEGVLEYSSRDDADRACRDLTGKTIRGRDVKVTFDDGMRGPAPSGVDNYRREPREYREDLRRRSRSPRRREDEGSTRRSPPRRYEERRDYRDERYRRDDYRGDYRREEDRYNRRDDDRYRR